MAIITTQDVTTSGFRAADDATVEAYALRWGMRHGRRAADGTHVLSARGRGVFPGPCCEGDEDRDADWMVELSALLVPGAAVVVTERRTDIEAILAGWACTVVSAEGIEHQESARDAHPRIAERGFDAAAERARTVVLRYETGAGSAREHALAV